MRGNFSGEGVEESVLIFVDESLDSSGRGLRRPGFLNPAVKQNDSGNREVRSGCL
jgi:hypothetical protein